MDRKRIGIIGCGWLGLPLGQQLVKENYGVHGASRSADKFPLITEAGMVPFQINVYPNRIDGLVESFFNVHTLIITLPPGRRTTKAVRLFPQRMAQIVDVAKNQGVQQLFFTSSTGVYGETEGTISETQQAYPTTDSGKALLQAEQILQNQSAIPTTILRLGGLVGPKRNPGRWLAGKTEVPKGNQVVNLVHQSDVLTILKQLLLEPPAFRLFNIVADGHPSRAAFYTKAAAGLGLTPPTFQSESSGKATGKLVDNQAIKTHLGYIFQYPDPMTFPEVCS